jgi:hypothetical protein
MQGPLSTTVFFCELRVPGAPGPDFGTWETTKIHCKAQNLQPIYLATDSFTNVL